MRANVAVLIPSSGRRLELLSRAIESVFAQSMQPSEIVVAVDGDDALRDIVVACVAQPRVMFVATGAPRGASAARNLAAASSRASFLCFLDDDDVWKSDYLASVFALDDPFDVALTAFEKHNRDGVRPEKVPPDELRESHFLVANPGLRGSNLVVSRATFEAAGGFDEALPAFNDMDFGLRLARLGPLRYRRVVAPLVEYHAHDGERLSRRGAPTVAPGMAAFLERHEARMSSVERASFRRRAIQLWGLDPWSPEHLAARTARACREGTLPACFPALLQAHESVLLEACACDDATVDEAQRAIDRLCHVWERTRPHQGRLERLRLVIITTDAPGAVDRLLASLLREAERTHWRPVTAAGAPWVEVLLLVNDGDPRRCGRRVTAPEFAKDRRLVVHEEEVVAPSRPLPTSLARAYAFDRVRHLGWEPSPLAPIWFLDEDMRFEVLLPSHTHGYRRAPGGSLLHRVEALVAEAAARGASVVVGGNSLAAPVPAAGVLRRQLVDLCAPLPRTSSPWGTAECLRGRLQHPDSYYDLARRPTEPSKTLWRTAWWRSDRTWDWDDVSDRLMRGLPVSRAALPTASDDGACAWGPFSTPGVAGGNTLVLDRAALRPDLFAVHHWEGIVSRRGDAVWCTRLAHEGVVVQMVSIPLAHDRVPRPGDPVAAGIRDALADALGVGMYQAHGRAHAPMREVVFEIAEARRAAVVSELDASLTHLSAAVAPDVPGAFVARMSAFVAALHDGLCGRRFESPRATGLGVAAALNTVRNNPSGAG